jgi:PAS domain S-box-containing protein
MDKIFTLDIKTIVLNYLIINFVSILILFVLRYQNRNRYRGTGFWIAGFTSQTIAMTMIALRAVLPVWVSFILSNTILAGGFLFYLIGLEKFVEKPKHHLLNFVLLFIYIVAQIWFTYYQPDLEVRRFIFAVVMVVYSAENTWLIFFGVRPGVKKMTYVIGLIFGAFCIISIIRAAKYFFDKNPSTDFFQPDIFESFIILFYQLFFYLLVFSVILMYHKRLQTDILGQEEKFLKAFQSSPYAVLISRLSDGLIVEANLGFMRISGYESSEVIGKTTDDLHLWMNESSRRTIIGELLANKSIYELEQKFRKKSGAIMTGLVSSEVIQLDNEKFVISSINDITDRKNSEKLISDKMEELHLFNRIMVGRENRMIELKSEINELCQQLGIPGKYESPEKARKV